MTLKNLRAGPIIWRSQSSTRVSISVAAGEVCHSMHWAPSVAVSISASTEGGLVAREVGEEIRVLPMGHSGQHDALEIGDDVGKRLGRSVGAAGSLAAISPGFTWARTG